MVYVARIEPIKDIVDTAVICPSCGRMIYKKDFVTATRQRPACVHSGTARERWWWIHPSSRWTAGAGDDIQGIRPGCL